VTHERGLTTLIISRQIILSGKTKRTDIFSALVYSQCRCNYSYCGVWEAWSDEQQNIHVMYTRVAFFGGAYLFQQYNEYKQVNIMSSSFASLLISVTWEGQSHDVLDSYTACS